MANYSIIIIRSSKDGDGRNQIKLDGWHRREDPTPTNRRQGVGGWGELLGAPDANLNAKNSIVITVFRVMFVSSIVPLQDLNRNGH